MRHLMPFLATGAMILTAGAAAADLGDQLFKLLASDGASGDYFGGHIAISGTTAIIAAQRDEESGIQSGSAYLFDLSDPKNPVQIAKLLPSDADEDDHFGSSVAISGDTAIVGAIGNDDNGSTSGSAYLFDIATGEQIAKLLPDDGAFNDQFGQAVGISGTIAIVGARFDDDNNTDSGSAYLFDTRTGEQIAKLLPKDGAFGDRFGSSVAISGAIAIIGAVTDDDNGFDSGSAYLFDITTGEQIAKLLPEDGAMSDKFGRAVAIRGTTVIVGADEHGDNGDKSGAAYLFDVTTEQQIGKLLPNDGMPDNHFGAAVAISGPPGDEVAIVGAFLDENNGAYTGSAYLFDVSTGQQIAKLLAEDGAHSDRFGISVAVSGPPGQEFALVGSYWDDDNGSRSGSAYLFDANTSAFPAALTSCSITFGSTDNPPCDVGNLTDDDDLDQILRSQFGFTSFVKNLTEIVIEGSGQQGAIMFSINTRDVSDTINVVAKVRALNFVTNSIDLIDQYNVSVSSDDTSHTTFVTSADYVDANGDIEVRLRYVAPATFTPLGFTVGLDQVEVMVN